MARLDLRGRDSDFLRAGFGIESKAGATFCGGLSSREGGDLSDASASFLLNAAAGSGMMDPLASIAITADGYAFSRDIGLRGAANAGITIFAQGLTGSDCFECPLQILGAAVLKSGHWLNTILACSPRL